VYQEFYGLREKPFSLTPDPQFLYLSEGHRTAIESLLYGIRQKEGFMVLTGDIGTGKTTTCRTILGRLTPEIKTAVLFNSFLTEEELLESILLEFGFTSKGKTRKERIDGLNRYLLHLLSRGKNAVLIIDEAQNLSTPVLEQIRMLSNLETEKEKMLQIILLGQLELEKKLQSPALRQLSQRISLRLRLDPLTRKETENYIYQRLSVAGGHGAITFSKPAFDEVYRFTKGIPRLINLLGERILLTGFVESACHFDKRMIKKAEESLRSGEAGSSASFLKTLSKPFAWMRTFSRMILLSFIAIMILSSPHSFPSLHAKYDFALQRAQALPDQASGTASPALSQMPPGKIFHSSSQDTVEPKEVLEEKTE